MQTCFDFQQFFKNKLYLNMAKLMNCIIRREYQLSESLELIEMIALLCQHSYKSYFFFLAKTVFMHPVIAQLYANLSADLVGVSWESDVKTDMIAPTEPPDLS